MQDNLSDVALAVAQYTFWTRLSEVSAAALIVYDYLITFDAAVEFQLRTRLSAGKVVFCLIRYCNVAVVVFNTYAMFKTGSSSEL